MKERQKKYRLFLYITFCLSLGALCFAWYMHFYEQIPSKIRIKAGTEQTLEFGVPATGELTRQGEDDAVAVSEQGKSNIPRNAIQMDFSKPMTMKADKLDQYEVQLKLFGIIPLKQVDIEVVKDKTLIPAGVPIGIYVKTQGVLVIGVGEFTAQNGSNCSPSKYLLKTGDYILKVNGEEVTGKNQFMKMIANGTGEAVVLNVRRGGEVFDLKVQPIRNQNGEYKLGIWIRDNAQGIGTLTYVDEDNQFGALGHGITDVDTSMLMELDTGTLYETEIIGIRKGSSGSPGELTGMIEYAKNRIRGEIDANTENGVFGVCTDEMKEELEEQALPIGLKQEVETGPASILCSVTGKPEYYDIEITEVRLEHDNVNRGIVLQITDPRLLSLTGGIVQGMSGSPIIQGGKMVGAVTHVLVNDPTKGYGIFIENMLEYN